MTTNETMTTLTERVNLMKEIIYVTSAYSRLPEELANIHKMIKTNDPKLENALNAFFGDETEDDPELDDMFGDNP